MGAQSHTGRTETGKCLLLLLAAVKRWVDNRRALGSGALGGCVQGRDEGQSEQMRENESPEPHSKDWDRHREGKGKGKASK